jgi:hypothetical protein
LFGDAIDMPQYLHRNLLWITDGRPLHFLEYPVHDVLPPLIRPHGSWRALANLDEATALAASHIMPPLAVDLGLLSPVEAPAGTTRLAMSSPPPPQILFLLTAKWQQGVCPPRQKRWESQLQEREEKCVPPSIFVYTHNNTRHVIDVPEGSVEKIAELAGMGAYDELAS